MFNEHRTRQSLSVVGLGLLGGMLLWWLWRRRSEQPFELMSPAEAARRPARATLARPEAASVLAGLAFPELEWLSPSRIEPARLETAPAAPKEAEMPARSATIPAAAMAPEMPAAPMAPEPARPAVEPGTAPDDLEVIEGIGPAIARVMRDAGITTFRQVAEADVERLREILRGAGLRLADPATWPEQARLAAAGDRKELADLQGRLRAGRQV